MDESICYHPIGTVHSPFESPEDVPKSADSTVDATGTVEVNEDYADGFEHIDGFSHLVLVTHLHEVEQSTMRCNPPFADVSPGIFATRGPRRPNPIGLSIVRLTGRHGTTLSVDGLDLVDGTPVLDIKPFAPKAGELVDIRGGWLEAATDQEFPPL
jgi:tRNA-Thr(GGU) m(6)t(6)A37 methyltransferase TsaA